MMLSPESFAQARKFVLHEARPLERALFRLHFEGATTAEARLALTAYQNADGGFGRALEPDLRLPGSSALATSVAFQHLRDLGLNARDPMVRAAVRWSQAAFEPTLGRWPAVPADANDWPHAPWWTWTSPDVPGFVANPCVELVAHLWHYREAADAGFLSEVTASTEGLVNALPEKPAMHDLLCLLCLAQTPAVPAVLRNQAALHARRAGPAIVARERKAWTGYAVKPLLLAPRSDSLLTPLLGDVLGANLDFEIGRQGADGSWAPNWDWSGNFPGHWVQAELEWKGVVTLQTLLTLRSYGRIAATEHEAVGQTYSLAHG
ncbi:MAG: hypothetical protein PHE83_13945 [Opitutaceae bacterium]|nr:hypothetical protein [Opitutaceae bacterium]